MGYVNVYKAMSGACTGETKWESVEVERDAAQYGGDFIATLDLEPMLDGEPPMVLENPCVDWQKVLTSAHTVRQMARAGSAEAVLMEELETLARKRLGGKG